MSNLCGDISRLTDGIDRCTEYRAIQLEIFVIVESGKFHDDMPCLSQVQPGKPSDDAFSNLDKVCLNAFISLGLIDFTGRVPLKSERSTDSIDVNFDSPIVLARIFFWQFVIAMGSNLRNVF